MSTEAPRLTKTVPASRRVELAKAPATVEKPVVHEDTKTSPDRLWNVIVWNDPINLMSYVTFVFQKLFGFSLQVATKHMLEVHHLGRSIVATVEREKAECYVGRLHQYGLHATMEKQEG
jgi:ATP-dependent Clp protease adaptor protein ClpS